MYRDANAVLLIDQHIEFVRGKPLPEYICNLGLAEVPSGIITELQAYLEKGNVHIRILTDSPYSIVPFSVTCNGHLCILWECSDTSDSDDDEYPLITSQNVIS